jgi:uncharacterized protein
MSGFASTQVLTGVISEPITCRALCGACCIAPSISSAIPGMPQGKPAGVACIQLDAAQRCKLFGLPERPAVCQALRPQVSMCGTDREGALLILETLERLTQPASR